MKGRLTEDDLSNIISNPIKTDEPQEPAPIFSQMVSLAIGRLKKRLQRYYQNAYPDLGEIIRPLIDEEEAKAREISFFPHLILPDLVDARIGKLGLQPAETRHDTARLSPDHYEKLNIYSICY
jgi:hypothetical protein